MFDPIETCFTSSSSFAPFTIVLSENVMSENTVQTTSQEELSIIQSEGRSIFPTGNILIALNPENRQRRVH